MKKFTVRINSPATFHDVYGICNKKFKKLSRQKRLVKIPFDLIYDYVKYFDVMVFDEPISKLKELLDTYKICFNMSVKKKSDEKNSQKQPDISGSCNEDILLVNEDVLLVNEIEGLNGKSVLADKGLFILTKNYSEATKIRLRL